MQTLQTEIPKLTAEQKLELVAEKLDEILLEMDRFEAELNQKN